MNGSGTALLGRPVKSEASTPPPKTRWSPSRLFAGAAVAVYALGMLAAMIWTAVVQGDWLLTLLILPQALCAAGFGAFSMGGALLAPDPYVKSH